MAAPIVTGTIALMKSLKKDITVAQARNVLYKTGVCVYRVLRLYIASSGILFHAVSVDLQGLSENIIIFPDGYGSGIWACVAARESVSQGHHIQHASFTYDRIFPDGGDISGND